MVCIIPVISIIYMLYYFVLSTEQGVEINLTKIENKINTISKNTYSSFFIPFSHDFLFFFKLQLISNMNEVSKWYYCLFKKCIILELETSALSNKSFKLSSK